MGSIMWSIIESIIKSIDPTDISTFKQPVTEVKKLCQFGLCRKAEIPCRPLLRLCS